MINSNPVGSLSYHLQWGVGGRSLNYTDILWYSFFYSKNTKFWNVSWTLTTKNLFLVFLNLPYNKSCKTSKNRDASTQENDDGDKDTIISLIFIFLFQLRWVKLWAISFVWKYLKWNLYTEKDGLRGYNKLTGLWGCGC